jgi:hypothetical protein
MSHKKILKTGKILNPTPHREAGGSAVSIVTMLKAGRPGIKTLSGKKFFFSQNVHTGCEIDTASYQSVPGLYAGSKEART